MKYNIFQKINKQEILIFAEIICKLDKYNRVLISEGGLPNIQKLLINDLNKEICNKLMLENVFYDTDNNDYKDILYANYVNVNDVNLSMFIEKIPQVIITPFEYKPQYLALLHLKKFIKKERLKLTEYAKLSIYMEVYHKTLQAYNKLMLDNIDSKTQVKKLTGVKRSLKNALFELSNVQELCSFVVFFFFLLSFLYFLFIVFFFFVVL